jgi:pimeloyl-ACP methyl ester carboxylesterase
MPGKPGLMTDPARGLIRYVTFVILLLFTGCFSPIDNDSSSSPAIVFYTNEATAQKLILFVHGVFGDPSTAWTNRHGESWPAMMRQDPDLRDYDIGTVQYDTPLLSRTSGIEEVATRVLRQLADEGVFKKYREVYFVSHSMGGLVVKRSLNKLGRAKETEKLRRVKAVMYISTPAQGADLASLGRWLSLNPQLQDMRTADLNSYLQSLDNDWNDLLRDRGNDLFPRSYCGYETQPTFGSVIVNRVLAERGCDQNAHPIYEDHSSIVKPANTKADVYVWTKARIREASDLAQGTSILYALHRAPYNYKPGLIVEGVEWKDGYREYDLLVRSPGKTDALVDVRFRFEFPWVMIHASISFQQGCEGLALTGETDQSFRFGTQREIQKLIAYRTNVLEINATRMFPESTFHARVVLNTGGLKTDDANVNVSYREGATGIKRSRVHRLTVIDAKVGTIRIEPEALKGSYTGSVIMQPEEPISFPGRPQKRCCPRFCPE